MPSTVGLGPLLGLVLWPFVGHGEEVLLECCSRLALRLRYYIMGTIAR